MLSSFISCTNINKYKEEETKVSINKKSFQITKNVVLFDTSFSERKIIRSNIVNIDGNDFISYINLENSLLVVYSITYKEVLQKHKINFEVEKYENVNTIILHNLDSIFILQFNRIILVNKDKIINQWSINQDTNSINCIDNLDYNSFYYDNNSNELTLQQYCCTCDFDSINFFKESPIIFYNISKNTYRLPNIQYSNKYFVDYYGYMNKVYISSDETNTYLSYAIDPNIYIIDRKTLKQKIVGGKCSFQKREALSLSNKYSDSKYSEKKIQHITLSHFYGKIIIDNFRHLYYRFYLDDLPEKNDKNMFTQFKDKRIVLMIFNTDWQVINEIPFEPSQNIKPQITYVTKEGLYIKSTKNYILIKP